MPTQIERERRFLIKFPSSWDSLAQMLDGLVDIERISQTYLKPKGDEPSPRVRKTIKGLSGETSVEYHFNQKRPVETGAHQETEHKITPKKYEEYLKNPYPGKGEVQKTRFVFEYHDQEFELDVFKGALKGLAILEIELDHKKDVVELPPFLEVIDEVTGEKKFNNFELADKTRK